MRLAGGRRKGGSTGFVTSPAAALDGPLSAGKELRLPWLAAGRSQASSAPAAGGAAVLGEYLVGYRRTQLRRQRHRGTREAVMAETRCLDAELAGRRADDPYAMQDKLDAVEVERDIGERRESASVNASDAENQYDHAHGIGGRYHRPNAVFVASSSSRAPPIASTSSSAR